jgi:hypothetical protein
MRIYTNRKGQIRGFGARPTEYLASKGLSVVPLLLGLFIFFSVFCNLMRANTVVTVVAIGCGRRSDVKGQD